MAENTKNTIQFTRSQFIGILCSALVAGVVGGIFGAVRTINSDHFALVALSAEVARSQSEFDQLKEKVATKEDLMKTENNLIRVIQLSTGRVATPLAPTVSQTTTTTTTSPTQPQTQEIPQATPIASPNDTQNDTPSLLDVAKGLFN